MPKEIATNAQRKEGGTRGRETIDAIDEIERIDKPNQCHNSDSIGYCIQNRQAFKKSSGGYSADPIDTPARYKELYDETNTCFEFQDVIKKTGNCHDQTAAKQNKELCNHYLPGYVEDQKKSQENDSDNYTTTSRSHFIVKTAFIRYSYYLEPKSRLVKEVNSQETQYECY